MNNNIIDYSQKVVEMRNIIKRLRILNKEEKKER